MRVFVIKTIFFSLITLIGLIAILLFVNYKVDAGAYYNLPANKKYLIVGHSHTECGYNDTIISDAINLSSGGECYFYTYFKLKKLLEENSHINAVFVGYSNNMINKEMDEWIWGDEYLSARYPKYSAFMEPSDIYLLLRNNPKELLATQPVATRKYIGFLWGNESNIMKDQAWGGYLFLERDKTDSLIKVAQNLPSIAPETEIAENNLRYLDKMISLCKESGVSFYLIRSPLHPAYRGVSNEELFMKTTTERYAGVEFLDFKDFSLSNSEFGDLDHLNFKGAKKFSQVIQQLLTNNLLEVDDKQAMIDSVIASQR